MAIKDIAGLRFGLLVALRPTKPKNNEFNMCWICKCDCGGAKEVRQGALVSGITRSCGCLSGGYLGYKNLSLTFFNSYKYGAASRGIEFGVDIHYCYDLFIKQNEKCALSGVDIILSRYRCGKHNTASLDRIDCNVGYENNNIRWVHKDVNRSKWDCPDDEYLEWCKKIANYSVVNPKSKKEISNV